MSQKFGLDNADNVEMRLMYFKNIHMNEYNVDDADNVKNFRL